MSSQIRRSAVSVLSNIVEGCARDTKADYLRFLYLAFGSLRELRYQISLSKRLNFLQESDLTNIEPKIIETEKVLSGLIKALKQKMNFIFCLQPWAYGLNTWGFYDQRLH